MYIKKISTVATIVGLLFAVGATVVAAQGASKSGDAILRVMEKKEAAVGSRTEDLKTRASKEIARRIASLTKVIERITSIKRLNDSQKSSLTSGVQKEIDSLKALESKIQADTDIETLRADVKSIVASYRIYLLFLPQTRIIIGADGFLNATDTFTEFANKLQSRINEVKDKGEDTSSMETTLADMQAKIADAKQQANEAINLVIPLEPADYPGNKSTLESARKMLQAAWQDLKTARLDGFKIVSDLRKLNKNISPSTEVAE